MKKFLLFSCLLLSICALTQAQFYERQLISPAGSYFETDHVQVTWVLGDIVSGAYDLGQLIVPYGVDVPRYDEFESMATLFPNPTTDKAFLHLHLEDIAACTYFLYDILGREIQNAKITSKQTELDFTPFESGVYILRLLKGQTVVQDFKIIKH
jgi:hypothetical protein